METSEESDTCFSVVPTFQQTDSMIAEVRTRNLEAAYREVGNEPDPRLHPDNFQLSENMRRHMEPMSGKDRNQFEKFVRGCRVRDVSLRPGMLIVKPLICATFTD